MSTLHHADLSQWTGVKNKYLFLISCVIMVMLMSYCQGCIVKVVWWRSYGQYYVIKLGYLA